MSLVKWQGIARIGLINIQRQGRNDGTDALAVKTVATVLVAMAGILFAAGHLVLCLLDLLHLRMLAFVVHGGHEHIGLCIEGLPGQQYHCQHQQVSHPVSFNCHAQVIQKTDSLFL